LPGVIRTRVGYAGGTTKNPTYGQIGDHSESIQIDYDPKVISYEQLLEIFWSSHNACAESGTRQYMTAVFYHDDAQKKLALKTQAALKAKQKHAIATKVLKATPFTVAEDYHQKFELQGNRALMAEFKAMYSDAKDFMNSTAAARVNSYLAGNGKLANLNKEIDRLGLSADGQKKLLQHFKAHGNGGD
jgi:methionine-S-sulfoxide reductase